MRFKNLLVAFLLTFFISNSFAQLISYTKVDSFSVEKLDQRWKRMGIPQVISKVRNAVDVYDITYYTTYGDGSQVVASGLYFMPIQPKKPAPLLIYNHGTTIRPQRKLGFNGEDQICLMFSTDGYAVCEPDYVGLGHGERRHLYIHADSEANAGIDMMKAVVELDSLMKLERDPMIFISGYSQGGHAAMAVHRKLQEKYADEYTVTASSPMSGPYDLDGVQADVMFAEYTQPHYLPYLLLGYNEVYNIFPKETFYQDVFSKPYDEIVQGVFNGKYSVGNINDTLPIVPKDMLSDSLVNEFQNNPDFEFKKLLQENSMDNWVPTRPMQICYCTGDEEVVYTNALVAHEAMKEM
ncbi:MAG: alpha/beta hydrolase family protein, partial [Flavobacteriales bacterium]